MQEWDNCGGGSKTPVTITRFCGLRPSASRTPQPITRPWPHKFNMSRPPPPLAPKASPPWESTPLPACWPTQSQGASLNTLLTLNPGTYHTVVQEWDNCGGSASTPSHHHGCRRGSGGQVTVTAPQTNTTVSSTVQYVASATSSCAKRRLRHGNLYGARCARLLDARRSAQYDCLPSARALTTRWCRNGITAADLRRLRSRSRSAAARLPAPLPIFINSQAGPDTPCCPRSTISALPARLPARRPPGR